MATKKGIKIKLYNVIYQLIDDLKDELIAKLPPVLEENTIGMFYILYLNIARYSFYYIIYIIEIYI